MMFKNINFKNFMKKKELFCYFNEFPYFVHQSAENAEENVHLKESVKKAKKEDDYAHLSKEVILPFFS